MANKHHAQHHSLLKKIKTTMRYHLTLIRMAIIKNLQTIKAGEGVEKRECSCTVGRNVNYTATIEDSMEIPLKTRNKTTI